MINQENRKQEKKNQHYVSRFYMKHFANIKNAGTPKEKVFISFYQFKGNLIKENIPTSSICSEDYFYDREGKIEDALSNMETRWGKAINHAINGSFTEEDIEIIREFVVYQIGRSKAMLAHNKEMAVNMMKYIITQKFGSITDEDAIKNLIENKVQNGITSAGGLSIAKEAVATIHDLKMKVVTNKTETRLITSDVPIIIINPVNSNCAGLLSAGEVIFFPISPWKMIFFYDSKLFDELPDRIFDENIIDIFNKYQYISANERILAKEIKDINRIINREELNTTRELFQNTQKTTTMDSDSETIFATKSRSIPYYYNIPILPLPKQLRKIPIEFREAFTREYSYDARLAILCRIYRTPDFISDKELKEHWKKQQAYSKALLNYFDYYWNTPKDDMRITPTLMKKLKTVPVTVYMNNQR